MKYSFPRFELTDSQRAWLEELYYAFKKGQYVDINHVKRKLWNVLSDDFNPNETARALAVYNCITPIGIWHIDPQTDIFEKIDKIFTSLKYLLIENYDANEIEIDNLLAKRSNITPDEIKRILKLVGSTSKSNSIRQLTVSSKPDTLDGRIDYIDVRSSELVDKGIITESIPRSVICSRVVTRQFFVTGMLIYWSSCDTYI
ncbi:MAG: hypothetical protein ACREOW_14070 [Thermodesulfobacteriota bacterium]